MFTIRKIIWKKQTSIAEKQYQSFDKAFKDDEEEKPVKIKKEESLTTDKSNLAYNNKYSFSKYKSIEKYINGSLTARYDNILVLFYQTLKDFERFTPWIVKTKTKKLFVYDNAIKSFIAQLRSILMIIIIQ